MAITIRSSSVKGLGGSVVEASCASVVAAVRLDAPVGLRPFPHDAQKAKTKKAAISVQKNVLITLSS